MVEQIISDILTPLSVFGGIALVITASAKAKLEHRKLDMRGSQPVQPAAPVNDALLTELRDLKRQIAEMQSTGHQFDISFDEALSRMEGRVSRLETKAAAPVAVPEAPAVLRNGQSQ